MSPARNPGLLALGLLLVAPLLGRGAPPAAAADTLQSTQLISRAPSGDAPDGSSTNAVISDDRRYARIVAFQSEASNLVPGDTNNAQDIFAVRRAGNPGNDGSEWTPGETILISKGLNGQPANGPSSRPSVDGAFRSAPRCVAFVSSATNLVTGDTNSRPDAFLSQGPGGSVRRMLLPGGHQPTEPVSEVAVSGDCSKVAFVSGGKLYVEAGKSVKELKAKGNAADPSFGRGQRNDLVFGAAAGVYLSRNGTGTPKLVAAGGRNPAYNDLGHRVVAYEKDFGGHTQIFQRELGHPEVLASGNAGTPGDGSSGDPEIGNSGFYITFQTDATNLVTGADGQAADRNGQTDAYLFGDTPVRTITLVQSVVDKGQPLPAGGAHPSLSYYSNYITFQSATPLGTVTGPPQIFMRYLGGI